MSSGDKDVRLVPNRFSINGSNTDVCKLEKLTNLFPEIKPVIELELFKFNNLPRLIGRLSTIYTNVTEINTRDDTLNYYLGPYHLSLGPATFGALHFRSISTALLASSNLKIPHDNNNNNQQQHKRRHDANIRRFRRAVRKLILIKSIIDKLRLASILTPHNQYELHTHGIYDLVLAGHIHSAYSIINDYNFVDRINGFRLIGTSERENTLFASNYMKISTLLQLISPAIHQQQPADSTVPIGQKIQFISDVPKQFSLDEIPPEPFVNPTTTCCPDHREDLPTAVVPFTRSISHYNNPFGTSESRSRLNSNSNSRRNSSTQSAQSVTHILPDLINNDNPVADKSLPSTTTPASNLISMESRKSAAIDSPTLSSRFVINKEDALVEHISSLLSSYLLARQSSHTHGIRKSNTILPTPSPTEITSTDSNIPIVDNNEINHLLQSIKTVVDEKLTIQNPNHGETCSSNCDHQHFSSGCLKKSKRNRPKPLLSSWSVSLEETPMDGFDEEQSNSSTSRRNKLQKSSKSLDETNCESLSPQVELNNEHEQC